MQTTCSESGITLLYGKHKGRLLMPARVQPPEGNNDQEWWPYNYNTAIYSDDGGRSWHTSAPVQSGTGEGTLAELSTGDIYYNSRSHMSVDHRRRIAWSHNGGEMFVDWRVSEHLYEVGQPFYFATTGYLLPIGEDGGSLLRAGYATDQGILWGQHQERRAEKRISAGGEDGDLVSAPLDREIDLGPLPTANPV